MIELADRQLIHITGEDAVEFSQSLFTLNVKSLQADQLGFGALLSPKGKIQSEFFIFAYKDGLLLDAWAGAKQFATKLAMYRLRAKVEVVPLDDVRVFADIDLKMLEEGAEPGMIWKRDPRHKAMGQRGYAFKPTSHSSITLGSKSSYTAYQERRHNLGLAELGADYDVDEIFPHEALYDQLGAVDFQKGCYIGQEVVSRMHHKTKPKSRFIKIQSKGDLCGLAKNDEMRAGGALIGKLASHSAHQGLALVRLDRASKARLAEARFKINDTEVSLALPDWVPFTWEDFAEEAS